MSDGLLLNPDKCEVLLLGTAAKLRAIEAVGQVSVTDALINLTDSLRNFGVSLTGSLPLTNQQTYRQHLPVVLLPHNSAQTDTMITVARGRQCRGNKNRLL